MTTKYVYTTMGKKKEEWGLGSWNDEPDKVQWTDSETGYPCLAVRNHMGAWCGYVGLSEGHPAFGRRYDEVDVDVHGGLTYADFCAEGPQESSICHIPEPGQPDHVWWLGWDCAHAFDLVPYMETYRRKTYEGTGNPLWAEHDFSEQYRTLDYVRRETTSLARQLATLGDT